MKQYEQSGADGIFIPFIIDEQDIAAAVSVGSLPLHVMSAPGLPDIDRLNALGVKRVSMGPFLFNKTYKYAANLVQQVVDSRNVSAIL